MTTNNKLTQYEFSKKVSELTKESDYSRSDLAKMLKISNSAVSQSLGEKYYYQTKLNGIRCKILNLLGYEMKKIPMQFYIDKLS